MKPKPKISPCGYCGKETYNQDIKWTGYCSPECELNGRSEKNES